MLETIFATIGSLIVGAMTLVLFGFLFILFLGFFFIGW